MRSEYHRMVEVFRCRRASANEGVATARRPSAEGDTTRRRRSLRAGEGAGRLTMDPEGIVVGEATDS